MSEQIQATLNFPPGFLWGTATAAHQVEGGNHNSWSAWEAGGGGRIFEDQVSGEACGWWDGRAEEDFDRAAAMHNNALRLSLEWSRIEPEMGRWDNAALARYRQMIRALRARGLEPMVTLHHFSNPLWLEEMGGWLAPGVPAMFARYCRYVAAALGDEVTLWCTLNEPMVYATQGHLFAYWPPGHADMNEMFEVTANLVRGHMEAYHAIKRVSPKAQIGLATHQIRFVPAGLPGAGHLAAWLTDYFINRMFFGPFRSKKLRMPFIKTIPLDARWTLDWIGLQYYHRYCVTLDPTQPKTLFLRQYARDSVPHGPGSWGEFAPGEIFALIRQLHRLTGGIPIYITEAGVPDSDNSIRPGYLARTLGAVWKACMHSYPLKGFFFWSLVDNFEWAEGFDPRYRFGLYGVDFATQQRTERRSARLYGAVAGANALTPGILREHAPETLAELFPAPRGRAVP